MGMHVVNCHHRLLTQLTPAASARSFALPPLSVATARVSQAEKAHHAQGHTRRQHHLAQALRRCRQSSRPCATQSHRIGAPSSAGARPPVEDARQRRSPSHNKERVRPTNGHGDWRAAQFHDCDLEVEVEYPQCERSSDWSLLGLLLQLLRARHAAQRTRDLGSPHGLLIRARRNDCMLKRTCCAQHAIRLGCWRGLDCRAPFSLL